MIYDIKKLTKDEVLMLRLLMKHYEKYDKLDLLIEKIVEDPEKLLN